MSNDLSSILARHNLKGINVATFNPSSASASHRPPPQHQSYQYAAPAPQQPYQYPAPISQPRTQYTWTPPSAQGGGYSGGQGAGNGSVRPSFAWPAPPQPRYTIDPRHYSYDIWGKAPVFSMDGEGEESEGEGETNPKEDDVAQEGEQVIEKEEEVVDEKEEEVVVEKEEEEAVEGDAQEEKKTVAEGDADGKEEEKKDDTEVAKPTEDAAAQDEEYIPAQSDDGPPEEPALDVTAATTEPVEHGPDASSVELSSDPPQEEMSSAPPAPMSAQPPVEQETVVAPTETTPEETDPEALSEPIASSAADAAARTSEATPEAVESMEPDTQTSEEVIEVEQEVAPEDPVAEAPVAFVDLEARGLDSAPEMQGEPIDSQQSVSHAEDIAPDDIAVAEALGSSDGNPTSTDPVPEDISQDRQPTDDIPEESPSAAEVDAKVLDTEPTVDAVLPDSEEIDPMIISPESENTPDSASIEALDNPDEIVQIIDIGEEGSTDDTAAIVVVPSSDDTAAIIVPPPPPSPGPHVTISEPVKPPKLIKKKSSSTKHSKSRTSEKPKEKAVEKPVEIITLREGKSKAAAKGKSKKKTKSMSSKGGEMVPPPRPLIVDVPPRAPSPPLSGTVIQYVEAEEVQNIDDCVPGGDTIDLPEAESEAIEVMQAGQAAVVAVPNEEQASAETTEQNDDVTATDISPPTETKDIASPLEDGDSGENVETGADVENKPEPTREELESSPPEADPTSKEPQVDSPADENPPHNLSAKDSSPDDGSSVTEEVTMESGNHDESALVTAEEQTQDVCMAGSPAEEAGETESPSPPTIESQANGEPESTETSTADMSKDNVVHSDSTEHGVDEAESQNPSIEAAGPEESISEKAMAKEPSPIDPEPAEHLPSEDTAPVTATEEISSAPMEESQPDSSEIVTEPAPTLMQLAALILPGEPAPKPTEDTAVPEAVHAEADVSTMEPAAANDTSDPIHKTTIGEDNDLDEQAIVIVLPDEGDACGVPPEAPMSPGMDPDTKLASGDEGEASQHQEVEETSEKVEGKDLQPELSPKVVAPVEAIAGDQEPEAETDISDKVVIDGVVESLKTDTVASEADASAVAGELDALQEQVPEASEVNANIIALDAPEMPEPQEIDIALPVVGEPDAIETAEAPQMSSNQGSRDTSITQVKQTDAPTPEQETLADCGDDGGAPDSAAPSIEEEDEEAAGVTPDPISMPVDEIESTESAAVVEKVVSADANTKAGEVASRLVTDDVDIEQPADREASTEHVTERHAAHEVEGVVVPDPASEQASEPLVVECGDEAREAPEEQDSTDPTKSHNIEDLSEQPTESTPQYISAKEDETVVNTIDSTDDATPSPTGDGAQTEDHDVPMLSMPVLAEEARVVEVPEAGAENISKPEEEKIEKAAELVDTPLLEEIPGSNEISSPEEQPTAPVEENAAKLSRSSEPRETTQGSNEAAQPEDSAQEPFTTDELLPGDSMSQQSRVETLPDSEPRRSSPLIEEPAVDPPAQVEDAASPPSKHSSEVSCDEPPVAPQSKETSSSTKERRKSSKSSSNRHSSSRHKVRDVSSPPSDPKRAPPPTQSRRRSSTAKAPPPGLFRTPSTTKPRLSRAEAAEQAEIRRRAAEIAAREQEVHRQLERARKRAALEEQEKQLREKEEELARLKAIEREKKRAKREEHKRRAQEALEQERAARERAEEEARQEEFERAGRRRRRSEAEGSGSRRHRDDRPRAHRQSASHWESGVRESSPIPVPKVSRHRTEEIGAERHRSRDEYYIREAPAAASRNPEQRRHRRSTRKESESVEKPKKGFWKSILGRI